MKRLATNIGRFFRLIRSLNLLIVAVSQYLAAWWLIPANTLGSLLTDQRLLLLALSTMLIAAGGYVINDYYDIKIDYINKPQRVVAGRYFSRRIILILHVALTAGGLALGWLAGWQIAAVDLVAAGLLWLYSARLKQLPLLGNLAVALLTASAILLVYLLYRQSLMLISVYGAFAFFMALIREIIKDMEDMEGDRTFNCRTLPIDIGIRPAKQVVYLISLLFIATTALLIHQDERFGRILLLLTLVLAYLNLRLHRADKLQDYARLSTWSKVIMLGGMLSMFFFKNSALL